MSQRNRVPIEALPTGVPGLDEILGGGIPLYSFNLIAGAPGSGKTILANQLMFANAGRGCAIYFTVLGEPPLKMLRYQQQFSFFRSEAVGERVHFIHLAEELLEQGLDLVLTRMVEHVERLQPALVFVDSFRAIARAVMSKPGSEAQLQGFLQQIALYLTALEATTFLIGEFSVEDDANPMFTVADGVIWLYQSVDLNSIVRKMQILKMRGRATSPGLHTFRLTDDGVRVFPRIIEPPDERSPHAARLITTGVPVLDEMLGGGIPCGQSVLVAGPSGSGKTTLCSQFVAASAPDERCVVAVFEKRPAGYLQSSIFGADLQRMVAEERLRIVCVRPLDLSIDETLYELREAILEIGATRLVVDSLLGLELALAPTFRRDFRESFYRMIGSLTDLGVTVLLTVEIVDNYTELRLSPNGISFLTDIIIMQRYVEINGCLEKVMGVVKHRTGKHSKQLKAYDITPEGIRVTDQFRNYRGLLTGEPVRARSSAFPGLLDAEREVLETLIEHGEADLETLARNGPASEEAVRQALARLVALGYATASRGDRWRVGSLTV